MGNSKLLVLLFVLSIAGSASAQMQPTYYCRYLTTEMQGEHAKWVAYYSDVFPHSPVKNEGSLYIAFEAYLDKEYRPLPGAPYCSAWKEYDSARQGKSRDINDDKERGYRVVDTKWSYPENEE